MCDENINLLISRDFAAVTDELNWANNTINPIVTEGDRLVLRPDSAVSAFSRNVGIIHADNNRLRYKLNLEIFRPSDSPDSIVNYLVQIYSGVNLIGQSTIYIEGIDAAQIIKYSLDRTYSYEELSGAISIKIKTPIGFNNEIRLQRLDVWDYNFCEENVRTYFVFADLFANSQTAASAGLRLQSWKVGGTETLTPAFFAQNGTTVGGNPVAGWKYAKADIDGANREAAANGRNTFNPFADEFGLIFANVAGNFYGGKPTGTVGGQDFGSGIMQLGFEKPAIVNGQLEVKTGAFFIDIDYTKDLYVECDVIVNNTSGSVYNSPTTNRKFFIKWNATTCVKEFYYKNNLQPAAAQVDQMPNGFLSGVTDITSENTVLPCGQLLNFNGAQGQFTFTLDLGTEIGMFGINYDARDVPDKFDLNWNGISITSNYRGKSTYDIQLQNAGIPNSQIATANPSNGAGQLRIFKTSAFPTTATVTVSAPLGTTAWTVRSACPPAYMEAWFYQAACGADITGTPTAVRYMMVENPLTFVPANGDTVYNNIELTAPYAGGNNVYRMRIPLGTNGNVAEIAYTFKINDAGVISDVQPCNP